MAVKAYIFSVKPATLIISFPSMPPNTPKNLNDRGHGKSKSESTKYAFVFTTAEVYDSSKRGWIGVKKYNKKHKKKPTINE